MTGYGWSLGDWVVGVVAVVVVVVVVAVGVTSWTDRERLWIRDCAEMRPLVECKVDAKELFR